MNLEQVIHQRWAAAEPLNALLPADRVKTGRSLDGALPYATVARLGNRTAFRTNSGDALVEVTLQVHVWHGDYDAGRAIADQVVAAFDRTDFALSGGDRVVHMRRTDDSATRHDDGTWQLSIEFLADVHLSSGT